MSEASWENLGKVFFIVRFHFGAVSVLQTVVGHLISLVLRFVCLLTDCEHFCTDIVLIALTIMFA